jgi:hypothetical protein
MSTSQSKRSAVSTVLNAWEVCSAGAIMTPGERACKNIFVVSLVLATIGATYGLLAVFGRALVAVL